MSPPQIASSLGSQKISLTAGVPASFFFKPGSAGGVTLSIQPLLTTQIDDVSMSATNDPTGEIAGTVNLLPSSAQPIPENVVRNLGLSFIGWQGGVLTLTSTAGGTAFLWWNQGSNQINAGQVYVDGVLVQSNGGGSGGGGNPTYQFSAVDFNALTGATSCTLTAGTAVNGDAAPGLTEYPGPLTNTAKVQIVANVIKNQLAVAGNLVVLKNGAPVMTIALAPAATGLLISTAFVPFAPTDVIGFGLEVNELVTGHLVSLAGYVVLT